MNIDQATLDLLYVITFSLGVYWLADFLSGRCAAPEENRAQMWTTGAFCLALYVPWTFPHIAYGACHPTFVLVITVWGALVLGAGGAVGRVLIRSGSGGLLGILAGWVLLLVTVPNF